MDRTPTFITIATTKGPQRVEADVFGAWAVHEHLYGLDQWTLTHVPTGRAVPEKYTYGLSRERLIEVAQKLGDQFKDATPDDEIACKRMASVIKPLLAAEGARV